MERRTLGIVACAVLVTLLVAGGDALAKKRPKPPPPPDGSAMNHALTFAAGSKVYVMTADGAQTATIAGGGKTPRTQPTWLLDGNRVAFQLEGDIYTVLPDGSGKTYVTWLNREYAYLVDDHIILHKRAGDLWVRDLATGAEQSLGVRSTLPEWETAAAPSATADLDPDTPGYQGWIAYVNRRLATSTDPTDTDIHIALLTGAEVGLFTLDPSTTRRLPWPTTQNLPEWSADGTTLAFLDDAGYVDAGRKLTVVDVDVSSASPFGSPRVLHMNSPTVDVLYRPAVSPDGRWVVFTHRVGPGKTELKRVSASGGALQALGRRLNLPVQPHWNPKWTNDLD